MVQFLDDWWIWQMIYFSVALVGMSIYYYPLVMRTSFPIFGMIPFSTAAVIAALCVIIGDASHKFWMASKL